MELLRALMSAATPRRTQGETSSSPRSVEAVDEEETEGISSPPPRMGQQNSPLMRSRGQVKRQGSMLMGFLGGDSGRQSSSLGGLLSSMKGDAEGGDGDASQSKKNWSLVRRDVTLVGIQLLEKEVWL